MRPILLTFSMLAALPLSAATQYTMNVDVTGRFPSSFAATVLAEGKQRRVEVAPESTLPLPFASLVSDDGGATFSDATENVGATIVVWTTDAVPTSFAVRPFELTTSEPGVDALLRPALATITGFPLKTSFSATRMFKGGPPETLAITSTVSNIRTIDAPPHAFDRPRLAQAAAASTPPQ